MDQIQEVLKALTFVYCTASSSEHGKRLDDGDRGEPSARRPKAAKQGISLRKLNSNVRDLFSTLQDAEYSICGVSLKMNVNYDRDEHRHSRRVNQLYCKESCQVIKDVLCQLARHFQAALDNSDAVQAYTIAQWFLQTFSAERATTVYSTFDPDLLYPMITARIFDNSANQLPKKPHFKALSILMRVVALSYSSVVNTQHKVPQRNGSFRCAPSFKERLSIFDPLALELITTLQGEAVATLKPVYHVINHIFDDTFGIQAAPVADEIDIDELQCVLQDLEPLLPAKYDMMQDAVMALGFDLDIDSIDSIDSIAHLLDHAPGAEPNTPGLEDLFWLDINPSDMDL